MAAKNTTRERPVRTTPEGDVIELPMSDDTLEMDEEHEGQDDNVTLSKADYEAVMAELKASREATAALQAQINSLPKEQGMVLQATKEPVWLVYMELAAPENKKTFGNHGTVSNLGDTFSVPHDAFFGGFRDADVRKRLDYGGLIIKSGLTKDEYRNIGYDYEKNARLLPEVLDKMLTMDSETLSAMFKELPPYHQELVARFMRKRFEENDNRVTSDRIKALNRVCDDKKLFGVLLEDIATKLKE